MVQKSIQSCLEELQSSGDVDNGDALNREATSGVSCQVGSRRSGRINRWGREHADEKRLYEPVTASVHL